MAAGASAFVNLLVYTPLILVWIGGLVIAGTLWSRQRAVALLLASACLLALCTEIAGGILTSTLPLAFTSRSRNVSQLGILFGIVGVIRSVLMAVAWGLVLGTVVRAVAPRPGLPAERDAREPRP
ncbi:MAG: hypothetical protein AVDCRST_MAG18-5036 [uncultured Thermomicrobiales bacterium]|uniref:Uncharacterized protein n=1 Tax=uncultured Thermomicrobiales bacterium TaxID=1645740 RepID=A0A6J4VV96_9BACT|nr:MAG: hypothetical protein AVDCRST_MAG18-5036 [uncultured Thermomicrobiales bacterium]